jgi:hypothetical protein
MKTAKLGGTRRTKLHATARQSSIFDSVGSFSQQYASRVRDLEIGDG